MDTVDSNSTLNELEKNATSIFATPVEISLEDEKPAVQQSTDFKENGSHGKMNENPKGSVYTQNLGGKTFVGSSSVGSRLASDDAIGSRLASSGYNSNSASTFQQNPSPIHTAAAPPQYNPAASANKAGFGNTSAQANTKKLGNMSVQEVQQLASNKAELVKSWSVKTYKCTKQMLSEKLGRGTRTVDLELEAKIEILKDTKLKYENLLVLTRALAEHFSSIVQTQKVLGSVFAELSSKTQELQEEFKYNAETQIVLARNGEKLLNAIKFFTSNVNTLCSKTMEDSLLTVSKYESARLAFDAYRSELEAINQLPRTDANIMKQASAQAQFNSNRLAYERLRDDVSVKLQFLDENRVKVMQKNLLLFHNAVSAYFAGNQNELEATMKQFNVQVSRREGKQSSWIEKDG